MEQILAKNATGQSFLMQMAKIENILLPSGHPGGRFEAGVQKVCFPLRLCSMLYIFGISHFSLDEWGTEMLPAQ